MKVQVQILAPGYKALRQTGSVATFRPVKFRDPNGAEVDGLQADLDARPRRWRSPLLAGDRAGVLMSGVMDLVLKWPSQGVQTAVSIDGRNLPTRSYELAELAIYEIGDLLAGGRPLPGFVLTVTSELLARIDELWAAGLNASTGVLEAMLGCLAQVSSAAAATHPYDRVTPLWSGLELLYPEQKRDMGRIDAITRGDPAFATEEEARGASTCSQLLAYRSTLAIDPWLHGSVRKRLQSKAKTSQERVEAATVLAYAIRSKIVHGQWARTREDRRSEAGAAEAWLWQLVERELELRLVGSRLPAVRSPGAAFSV